MLLLEAVLVEVGCAGVVVEEFTTSILIGGGFRLVPSFILDDATLDDEVEAGIFLLLLES